MSDREEFENWVTNTYTDLPAFEHLSKYKNGDYYHDEIIYAWEAWQHQQKRIDELEKKIKEISLDFRMNEQYLSVATSALERMSVVGTKTAIQALDIIKKLKGE